MSRLENLVSSLLASPESSRLALIQAKLADFRAQGMTDLVLFGSGQLGRTACRMLMVKGSPPLAFVDNNPGTWGGFVEGLPVLPPEEARRRFGKRAVFVVTIYNNSPVIQELQLQGLAVLSFPEMAWCFPDECLPCGPLARPSYYAAEAIRIQAAMGLWADGFSMREYLGQLAWRMTLDSLYLPPSLPPADLYFPDDLVRLVPEDIFVDCGAYDGDTLRSFLTRVPGGPKHYYGVEPDLGNAARLSAALEAMPPGVAQDNTVLRCALGAEALVSQLVHTGKPESYLGTEGMSETQVLKLDDLLSEVAPTYIKMDIEGSERAALEGASRILRFHSPVLAVCLYHKPQDLWDLPLLMHELVPESRLFLRRYAADCWETVCYAIPPKRLLLAESDSLPMSL